MRAAFIYLFLLIAGMAMGQSVQQNSRNEFLVQAGLTFDQKEFGERFAVKVSSEDDYDYYVTDLTKFPGRFERIYFLNLTYGDHKIVNIDPDIQNSQLWFKAHYKYAENEITCQLDDYRKETLKISQSWTDSEKQAWLNKYDKFNTLKDNGK
jgi:hypothetical protein